jgi:hypothetical protein
MKKNLLTVTLLACVLMLITDIIAQQSRSRRSSVPRPLLYPFPETPGETPLADVRKKMLKEFDDDKDGLLNKSERNKMRLATKNESNERHAEIRRLRDRRSGRSSREENTPTPPERWLALYDKNKNGRFDGTEWDTARRTEIKQVSEKYDSNKNGKIDDDEKKTITNDLQRNKFNQYDNYILTIVGGMREERSSRSRRETGSRWKEFDSDGNGKASTEELAAIRKNEKQSQQKQ